MNKSVYLDSEIVVIGLGYVGFPLATKLSSVFKVIGFDISSNRINELKEGKDLTREISIEKFKKIKNLRLTSNPEDIFKKNIYIVTVPTPLKKNNVPDLSFLKEACRLVGKNINKYGIAIFESTVYPGVTEKICGSIIEEESNLKLNKGFFLGYSPERINPGDKKHTIEKITKVVSGSNKEITKIIGKIYESIIHKGVHYAQSIKIAEMAKAIENAQRDINIAFVNEVAMLCQHLDISVYDVLEAACTKWNFLPFQPGLVGGHCIGVDPYYLAHLAKGLGYDTKLILAGRHLNDEMTDLIFSIIKKDISLKDRILQIGVTFKENVPDIRNSKAAELANFFINSGYNLDLYDPVAQQEEVLKIYGLKLTKPVGHYDYIIFAVPHEPLVSNFNQEISKYYKNTSIIFDIKGVLKNKTLKKNIIYKSL